MNKWYTLEWSDGQRFAVVTYQREDAAELARALRLIIAGEDECEVFTCKDGSTFTVELTPEQAQYMLDQMIEWGHAS